MQAQQDSFQAAIDYLLRGRQQATQQRQGLFTQAQAPAPTTNISNVVRDVFGDRYMNQGGSDSGNMGGNAFVGNPFASGVTGSGLGFRGMSPGDWSNLASSLRGEGGNIAGVTGLLTGNPLIGVAAKYGVPAFADYMAKQTYQPFMDSGVYDYLSQENVNRDLVEAGFEPAGYSETPITISPEEMSNTYQSSGSDYVSGYGDSGVSGGYGYSGEGSDYGRSGAGSDRD